MAIPRLVTDRLVLRALTIDDFTAYAGFWSDPAVVNFIGGEPMSRERAWGRMLSVSGGWPLLGFGFLAITERDSGRLVGEAGFQDMRRDISPSIEGTLETGWALLPEVHGRGYATEALTALMAWARPLFVGRRLTCIIDPENAPSLRLAARMGFVEETRSSYRDHPIVILGRTLD